MIIIGVKGVRYIQIQGSHWGQNLVRSEFKLDSHLRGDIKSDKIERLKTCKMISGRIKMGQDVTNEDFSQLKG